MSDVLPCQPSFEVVHLVLGTAVCPDVRYQLSCLSVDEADEVHN